MAKRKYGKMTEDERNIHKTAVKLRGLPDKELVDRVRGTGMGAGSPHVAQDASEEAMPNKNTSDLEKLLSALSEGKCKGIKGATAYKVAQFAAEMGLV